MKDKLKDLKETRDIQGQSGNWDQDPYMTGLYNGLELAVAIFEEREPEYRPINKNKEICSIASEVEQCGLASAT